MNIQERRLEKGWSQEELSQHSGLSVRTIQRIERGQRPGLESLKCLAAVFETSISTLMQEQNMTNTQPAEQSPMNEFEREAIEYVQNLKAFHMNWIAFLVIIPGLAAFNSIISPDFWWVAIVALGWGLGIILHAITIFGLFGIFGAKWEQQQFRKRMGKYTG